MHWIIERALVGRKDRQTVAKTALGLDRYTGLLLIASAALLGVGITMPVMMVTEMLGLSGPFSILDLVLAFFKIEQGGMAIAIALLLIVMPCMITATAFDIWYKYTLESELFERRYSRMVKFSRLWFLSMAALVGGLYYVKTALPDTDLYPAVYALLLALIVQKLAVGRIIRLVSAIKFVDHSEDD